jgi:Cof subfamily protein (haloacid dehalogenase superfamily)
LTATATCGSQDPRKTGSPDVPYRIAAIDLDETLLGANGTITPRNAAAVNRLRAAGVLCVIASGRMHQATLRFADELGLDGPLISYNGAMIRVRSTGETWLHTTIAPGPAAEVVRYCAENGYHLNYYLNDHLHVSEVGRWAEFYHNHTGSKMEPVGDLRALAGTRPTKMILIDEPAEADRLYGELGARFAGVLDLARTNPEYLEFMDPSCNKGRALEVLADRLEVPRLQTLAFGDGGNDLPMVRWAGFSVAMGSGKEAVRAAASWVAPRYDEDGFAVAVDAILDGRLRQAQAPDLAAKGMDTQSLATEGASQATKGGDAP